MITPPEVAFQTPLQNQTETLRALKQLDPPVIIWLYGDAGVGKSRLLHEASLALGLGVQHPLRILVDLATLVPSPTVAGHGRTCAALVEALAAPLQVTISDGLSLDERAHGVCEAFLRQAQQSRACLMLDTAESIQDIEFWRWVECNLLDPLLSDGKTSIILAGRSMKRLELPHVRNAVKGLHVPPLDEPHRRQMALDLAPILPEGGFAKAGSPDLDLAAAVIADISQGIPELAEQLAAALHMTTGSPDGPEAQAVLYRTAVKPYIEERLFSGLDPEWQSALLWASVLDRFGVPELQQFLGTLRGDEYASRPVKEFNRGVSQARLQGAISWPDRKDGYQFSAPVREVLRSYLRTVDPEGYRQAERAAELTKDGPPDQPGPTQRGEAS